MTENTRPSHSARTWGKGIGQLLRGQWKEAATTLRLRTWLGRYAGFSLVLSGGLALLLTVASFLLPTSLDWIKVALAIFVCSIFLLPFAIGVVYSTFGRWGARFDATSFRGGCVEGMLLATLFLIVMFALRWTTGSKRTPPQATTPPSQQIRQSLDLDLFVPETAQRSLDTNAVAESLKAYTDFDKSTPGFSSLALGRDLAKAEKFEEAAQAFTDAIDENPKLWPAFQERGRLLASFGIHDQAIEDFSDVLHLSPGLRSGYKDRASSWFELGEMDKTIVDCTSSLSGNFADPDVFNLRGLARSYKGDNRRAIEDFTAALRLDPKLAIVFSNRAHSLTAVGALSEALADCNRALRLDPMLPDAYHRRGRVYRSLQDWPESLKDFDKAIELDPEFPDAFADRALLRITATGNLGNAERAIQDATTACELTNWQDFMTVEVLARAYLAAGNAKNARQYADQMVKIAPATHQSIANRARDEILKATQQ